MSFLKSVGIDVGIVQKGLNYKVSLCNERIDAILNGDVSIAGGDAFAVTYNPTSIGNWGICGCSSIGNVGTGLDILARLRAITIDEIDAVETRVTTLESTGGGLSNWSEDSNGSLLPNGNDTQDLGSASQKVRDLYLGPSSLKIVGDDDVTHTYDEAWFEGRASQVSLGNLTGRVGTLESATDDDSAYATKVSLGNLKVSLGAVDTRVSGLETLSAYTISSLPASSNDGTQALVSDGADTGVALAYHYDRAWYRSFDNLVLADSKWSPADTTTQLWFDASDLSSLTVNGTDLTQWSDKSGNGYHLTKDQNASSHPQSGTASLRGRNVIEFGAGDSLTNLSWSYPNSNGAIYVAFVTKAYTSDPAQDFLLHHTSFTTNGKRMSLRRSAGNFQWLGGNADDSVVSTQSLSGCPEGEDTIGVLKIDDTNSSITKYNQTGSNSVNTNFGNRDLDHISVGSNEQESFSLVGYFAEIIYFTGATDVEKVEGYLAHKWGLDAHLPSSHAYKSLAP